MDDPGPWDDLESSPWGQCLNRACTRIIDADLDGIAGNVWIRDPPTLKLSGGSLLPMPAVLISPLSASHSPSDGSLTAPDLYVRAMVGIVASDSRSVGANLAARLLWYHQVFKLFAKIPSIFDLEEPGADLVDLVRVLVEPGDPRVIAAWQLTFDAEWLTVNFHLRYPTTAV